MSATARMPWAPWKYASRRSSRKPLDPMMSQIVMSICTGSPPFGLSASSFLETFAPKVTMYRSSYSLRTYRLMREVLPTACSPTKQTLTFIRRGSIMTMRRRRGAKILSARAICEGLFSRFVRTGGVPPRRGHVRFSGLGFRRIPEHDDRPLVGSRQCIYPRISTAGRGLGPDDDPHLHARAPASRNRPLFGRDAREGRSRMGHRPVGRRALVVGLLGNA